MLATTWSTNTQTWRLPGIGRRRRSFPSSHSDARSEMGGCDGAHALPSAAGGDATVEAKEGGGEGGGAKGSAGEREGTLTGEACSQDGAGGEADFPPHVVDQELLEPYHYILRVPGKDVRGLMVEAFQDWLAIPQEKVEQVKEIVGMLHTSSLLVDDIEDNSKLRRGVPVAHLIYGLPSTLNTANYAYFLALEKVVRFDCQAALGCFVGEMLNLHKGQGQDILWRDSGRCPTEEEYTEMVINKTGGLFRLAVGLMQPFSKDSRSFTALLDKLALYFQIRDDLINLSGEEYMKSKSYCEDLTEGKFSFPIIHCIRSRPTDHRLLNILKQRTEDVEVKRHAVSWMRQTGSFSYTLEATNRLKAEVLSEVERLGGHPKLEHLIELLDGQLSKQMPDWVSWSSPSAASKANGEERFAVDQI